MTGAVRSLECGDIEAGNNNGNVGNVVRNYSQFEGNNNGDLADNDKLASSLSRILDDVPEYMCSSGHAGRLSRIPESIKVVNMKAYNPCFLSIGPYHHGRPRLELMEKRKQLVLKCILEKKPELTLKVCLKEFKSIEPQARGFYSDIEMESQNFVNMMLLDSLYIVTMFCGMPKGQDSTNDYSNEMVTRMLEMDDESRRGENNVDEPRWFWTLFVHDIFLLENQLPLFVLQRMYDLIYADSEKQLIDIMKDILHDVLSEYIKLDSDIVISPNEEIHNLLHLCHIFFRPTLQRESNTSEFPPSDPIFRLGSAMQLYEAGVCFEARSDSTQHSLLDITFDSSSGRMAMPCLHVDDNTDSLLRNLIALEQMKYPCMGLHVSAYAVLLLHLVTTPEDVELLRRMGIIQHHLASDKEMMYLVNRLSVGLAFDYAEDDYSLKHVFRELKIFSDRRIPRWRAWLKHRYFNNPWTMISLLAASLLLFLSFLETFYSVYSYYHPRFHR